MADRIDQETPQSPGWWLKKLHQQIHNRRSRFNLLERYYIGEHPIPEGDERARELFRQFQRKARTNYTGLIVDSVRERMKVVGFRTGGAGTNQTDKEAWRIWQANKMDASQILVHQAMLTMSEAYVIVGPRQTDPKTPIITPEDPRQVTVDIDPMDRTTVRAALKHWRDNLDGATHAIIYLPDAFHYFIKPESGDWQTEKAPADNELGVVPVVPFINRPKLMPTDTGPEQWAPGWGEFEDVLDVQDRINNITLDRLIIIKMQAYRQRWAKGIATTDDNGEPLDLPFIPGVDLLWAVEDDTAEFGEFGVTDVGPVLNATKEDVRQIAAISRTPPHYLVGEMNNVNGETLKATETGLVSKVNERNTFAGESWERVMWLCGQWAEVPSLQNAVDTETIWADPESRTVAELADAAVKKAAAGVPWRQRMEDLGYSPQQIERLEIERAQDMLMEQAMAPQQATAGGSGSNVPAVSSLAQHSLYEGQWGA